MEQWFRCLPCQRNDSSEFPLDAELNLNDDQYSDGVRKLKTKKTIKGKSAGPVQETSPTSEERALVTGQLGRTTTFPTGATIKLAYPTGNTLSTTMGTSSRQLELSLNVPPGTTIQIITALSESLSVNPLPLSSVIPAGESETTVTPIEHQSASADEGEILPDGHANSPTGSETPAEPETPSAGLVQTTTPLQRPSDTTTIPDSGTGPESPTETKPAESLDGSEEDTLETKNDQTSLIIERTDEFTCYETGCETRQSPGSCPEAPTLWRAQTRAGSEEFS